MEHVHGGKCAEEQGNLFCFTVNRDFTQCVCAQSLPICGNLPVLVDG